MLRNEQITTLCDRLLKAATEGEAVQTAAELKAALHEHLETIRGNLLVSIAQELPGSILEIPDLPES